VRKKTKKKLNNLLFNLSNPSIKSIHQSKMVIQDSVSKVKTSFVNMVKTLQEITINYLASENDKLRKIVIQKNEELVKMRTEMENIRSQLIISISRRKDSADSAIQTCRQPDNDHDSDNLDLCCPVRFSYSEEELSDSVYIDTNEEDDFIELPQLEDNNVIATTTTNNNMSLAWPVGVHALVSSTTTTDDDDIHVYSKMYDNREKIFVPLEYLKRKIRDLSSCSSTVDNASSQTLHSFGPELPV
jgi:hypothetical protein